MSKNLKDKNILLVISGGIAAYKALELIRLMRKSGADVRCVLTSGGARFITPLSVASISENEVYTDIWSLKDETEMGHIRLSREADLIVIAPASANIISQMANGMATDLASTMLLAAHTPVLIAPAMNHKMWSNPATQTNIKSLSQRGVLITGPTEGDMACGEFGMGRMTEPEDILDAVLSFFFERPLKGLKAVVTAGPTYEPIDPVRFIGNRSSGKQGYAIAAALAHLGADVTLISGPSSLHDPANIKTIRVETAAEMLKACEKALPAHIAVCTAAVSDWRAADPQAHKIKKRDDKSAPTLKLKENPDILKTLGKHKKRPKLLIGFAAETEKLLDNAREKLQSKKCDWIVANDVSENENIFGGDENHVFLLSNSGTEEWPRAGKDEIARRMAGQIKDYFKSDERNQQAAE